MNTRTKAVAIGATVLVLGGIGTSAVVATATGADLNPVNDSVPADAEQAALDEVGSGKVTDSETDDEGGAYEIEVTRDDGTQVDVHLDSDFSVLSTDEDGVDDGNDSEDNDADDRALGADEQKQAEQAALAEVGQGDVTDVGAEDGTVDGKDVAYEVEVTRGDRTEVDVYLDKSFAVVSTVEDGTPDDDGDDANEGSDD